MQSFTNSSLGFNGPAHDQYWEYRKIKNWKKHLATVSLDDQLKAHMLYGKGRRDNIYQELRGFWVKNGCTKEAKDACGRWLERNGRLNARN